MVHVLPDIFRTYVKLSQLGVPTLGRFCVSPNSAIYDNPVQGTLLMNILFLCTGNSCRSILAEATFNHLVPTGWHAMSAGSHPSGHVHPRSLALLSSEGIKTEGYHSKSWNNLPHTPDIVVTVCAHAAGETCPAYLGKVLRTHWGVKDPAHVSGTDAEIDASFMTAYQILRARIEAFLALPLGELQHDPDKFKAELDRMGLLTSV